MPRQILNPISASRFVASIDPVENLDSNFRHEFNGKVVGLSNGPRAMECSARGEASVLRRTTDALLSPHCEPRSARASPFVDTGHGI